MKVETNLNEGDAIFFISNKKVCDSIVRGFVIDRRNEKTKITYLGSKEPEEKSVFIKIEEEDAFPSKEALLKSL